MKIGILRETKIPPDRRVPLIPGQVKQLTDHHPEVECVVQSSDGRCIADDEYVASGIRVSDSIAGCDLLAGVKEVSIDSLIPGKTYLFFSHTAKKQPYNRQLLREIMDKKITLIDYEYLTDDHHNRLVAFGKWAGIVGAYNGLRAWGERTGAYHLKPAHACHDRKEMNRQLSEVVLPPVKILITGGGRVAHGAMETLSILGLKQVPPEDFLTGEFPEPVVCRIDPDHYVQRRDHEPFDLQHFFGHPEQYESVFKPYTRATDLMIACHYWDPASPVFMVPEDYREERFRISVIADVSCDIGKPIPSTLRASTIADPFYGYNRHTGNEGDPFNLDNVTVMAVDNLPGELPRDASADFGDMLLKAVFPAMIRSLNEPVIARATIVKNGKLTENFAYLQAFAAGKE